MTPSLRPTPPHASVDCGNQAGAIDHFGLLGFTRHTAAPGRLIGGSLMVAGMLLIGKF
jgi:hypothetical protein